jgi:hypothetical protein
MTTFEIIENHKDEIAELFLLGKKSYEVASRLVRDHKYKMDDLDLDILDSFKKSADYRNIKKQLESTALVSVKNIREASERCIDTALERLTIAGMQRARIERLIASEAEEKVYRKEIRSEIELYNELLNSEDKRTERMSYSAPAKKVDSTSHSVSDPSEWPDEDMNSKA